SLPSSDLHHLLLPSFPTRRSSDLTCCLETGATRRHLVEHHAQRKQVGPSIDLVLSKRLLRRYVHDGAERGAGAGDIPFGNAFGRSEEHTSELQSRFDLVCRLLLEK